MVTDPIDLLCPCQAVLLEVVGQVQEGVPFQVLAVTQDDQQALLLCTKEPQVLTSMF